MQKNKRWYVFQELIAEHFRSLGASASTNISLDGVRTKHDIDVFVVTKFLGTDIKWVIEAKYWKTNVPKDKVLTLRSVVDEVGADKGFLISEKGFQSGAIEAASKTNVQLVTFEALKERTKNIVQGELLNAYESRADLLVKRYFSHGKAVRIKYGLRDDPYEFNLRFSGQLFIAMIFAAIERAKENRYPMCVKSLLEVHVGEDIVDSYAEFSNWLNINLNMFDEMLLRAEHAMIIGGDFKPSVEDERDLQAVEHNRKHQERMRKSYILMGQALLAEASQKS
ncbi:restriction endonuclease [Herbaspirillum sp. 3R-11]|nr:restriction endonuclease [Herbaspirillum sp. 3R-11]RFB70833.1 restriction endonuclease [Herbaspirillum sp. 3R-3a1]TFI08642.1 restriction endonuclease [Herbaspirillum sp. 3R11]TFI15557.1 restriction endonuclease [Herbaspirillum sp. 3R-11]TFI29754.1 restriction endonuclease [Herbaspirillum sp. 3C11]